MLRILAILSFVLTLLLLSGCSSERGVDVVVMLETSDPTITVDGVHFSAANSAMGMSKSGGAPEPDSDGSIRHDHVIDSPEGNFVIVDLLRNEVPFRSEIYKLDPVILQSIGNESEWTTPDGVASDEEYLNFRLMKEPDSFAPAVDDFEFHTKMRYEVVKPYSY